MEWFNKHADSISVISVLILAMVWMNTRFNEIDRRFSDIEKEMAIIKTVLVMKGVMPTELARADINVGGINESIQR